MKYQVFTVLCCLLLAASARATETENLGISVLPAPGKVVVDGKTGDWDLSGGVFVCGDVEHMRDRFALWLHAMYDADNLYLLARWTDETPLNNPGQIAGSYGFQGDCLQVRIVTAPDKPQELGNHFTCWQDRNREDVIFVEVGKEFKGGTLKDAKTRGAKQALTKNADGKGYIQEISLPWKLLAKDGRAPAAGETIRLTVEPNFTIGQSGRLTLKDIFQPAVKPDRVFTFMSWPCWGPATLERRGNIQPRPVRLADAREIKVHMAGGVPVADWSALVRAEAAGGFKPIKFSIPEDGYVSLHILNDQRQVVCQLLNQAWKIKGQHDVQWDALTTKNYQTPGQAVPPGNYTWQAIWHKGIGLRLCGWACNSGSAPWDSGPASNWGGDHGVPCAAATAGGQVFLGWNGAEAGSALLACDLAGNVLWKNSRQGMAGAELVAVDGDLLYAVNWGPESSNYIYRLHIASGAYASYSDNSPDIFLPQVFSKAAAPPQRIEGLAARDGKLYLSVNSACYLRQQADKPNLVAVVDAQTRQLLRTWKVASPRHLYAVNEKLVYVVSASTTVLALDASNGTTRTVIANLHNATGITVDKQGRIYVGVGDPDNQVKIFTPEGKFLRAIGRPGGRRLIGPWQPEGMAFIAGIAVDRDGKLWVTEADAAPKRVSTWDLETGKFVQEYFGATAYGALGGAINPLDPCLMVGHGCEWRIDRQTGRAACLGCFVRGGVSNARFGVGANGRLYLAVASGWAYDNSPVQIFERLGDAQYKLRSSFTYEGKDKDGKTIFWADENGDGRQQAGEVTSMSGHARFSGWYMNFAPDMTIYADDHQYKVVGFTPCGAPKYDLRKPLTMPAKGMGSPDGCCVLRIGDYGVSESWFDCFDVASGKKLWSYPDNFVGVHGSHQACPPVVGMIRGSFGPCGVAGLPSPIGGVWVIPTNVGEWHLLTEDGFYLTRLFQGDPMKVVWPEKALPGAVLDDCPPGLGGEDFGGSCCLAANGKLYLQAGKTGFWNIEVTGLDTVKNLGAGQVSVSPSDVVKAEEIRVKQLQAAVGTKRMAVRRKALALSGNFDQDCSGADVIRFQKQEDAPIRAAAAWDDDNLYLAWDVRDRTPWINKATMAEQMYVAGDTVDFQLGVDTAADKKRDEAAHGDLRLSIGNFQGHPTAVIYRRLSEAKRPKDFSSGVIKTYRMEYVDIVPQAKIKVSVRPQDGYLVEAAIPLAVLGLAPHAGLVLPADFGVTYGGPDGGRTRLRAYWNNQHTGIVDDAVFELKMEPRNWGLLEFKE
jgi:outer membrane protein assembly factor BamB